MPKHTKLFVPDSIEPTKPAQHKITLYTWEKTVALIPECFQKAIYELREQLNSEDEKLRCRGIEMMLKYVTKINGVQACLAKDMERAQSATAQEDAATVYARELDAINHMDKSELLQVLFNEVKSFESETLGQAFEMIMPKSMQPKAKRGRAKTS